MKLILENWQKFLNEEVEEQELAKAKELIKRNFHLKGYADAITDKNLIEAGNYILLYTPPKMLNDGDRGTFGHIKHSHTRQSDLPGSKFNDNIMTDEELIKLVVEFLKKAGKHDDRESHPKFGAKLKWFNKEQKNDIGLDSIVHKDEVPNANPTTFDFREKVGNNRAIPAIMAQGLTVLDAQGNKLAKPEDANPTGQYFTQQDIPVIDGPLRPTKKLNVILGDLGKIGSKTFVSVVSLYPGHTEPEARNKKDFAKLGYYFLKGNK